MWFESRRLVLVVIAGHFGYAWDQRFSDGNHNYTYKDSDSSLRCVRADYSLVIESPYHCAADEYDMRQGRSSIFTPF